MTTTSNQYNPQTPPGYPNGSYGYPAASIPEDRPINWKKYFFLFLSNWYWFLITLGITLGIAFFKIRYTIPKYQASATLIIEEDDNTQDIMSQFRSIRYMQRRADMANEVAKLGSFSIAKRTIDNLNQDIFWTAHGRIRERPLYENPILELVVKNDSINWYKNIRWFIDILGEKKYRLYQNEGLDTVLFLNELQNINDWQFIVNRIPDMRGHSTYSFVVNDEVELSNYYRSKLQIEIDEKEGTLITLRSEGPVGEREADYLNELCKSYISSGLERKQQTAENTFQFIDEQIDIILDSLRQSENQLLTFRLSNNVINLSREGDMAFERLKGFHESKTQLKLKENYYIYLKKYVEARNDPQTIISPTLTDANDQLLIEAVLEMQKLYEERENLDFSAAANNPGIENINERIRWTRLRILEIIDGLIDNNTLTLQQINIEEQAIIDQLKTLPLSEQQLLNIKRKYDLYNQFYTFLLQKRAEAGIQKASTISNVNILDQARYDQLVPIRNNKKAILLIALLAGLFIPAGFFFLRDLLDNQIREREDLTNHTDIPIIGVIGHSLKEGMLIDPNSSFTEALRRIRSNLQFMLRDPDQKVIMVTSSVSGEGKTFTASNLATIFAINNKKVLLIGCDLRKPSLHRSFNIKNSNGLSSVIIGEKNVEECIIQTPVQNLSLLPSGPIPPNPAELLETIEMQQLFSRLRSEYDYIILDTPPVALVSDALSLAKFVDLTVYVVRQSFSNKDVINIANQMASEERLPKMGLLINDIKPKRSMGYNYYYGYNRGHNYGYYDYSNYYSKDSET
jgi:capsular exopolysaccharide synthesis family protein